MGATKICRAALRRLPNRLRHCEYDLFDEQRTDAGCAEGGRAARCTHATLTRQRRGPEAQDHLCHGQRGRLHHIQPDYSDL